MRGCKHLEINSVANVPKSTGKNRQTGFDASPHRANRLSLFGNWRFCAGSLFNIRTSNLNWLPLIPATAHIIIIIIISQLAR